MPSAPKPAYRYPAKVLRIIDGDTIVCRVDLGFTVMLNIKMRFARINAPDIEPGKTKATQYLEALISGKDIMIESHRTEKYGRWLAEIWSMETGNNINDMMVSSGNAVVVG